LKIYISQGIVAMQLRCGGIFSNHFITNFATECASENNFENRSIFGEDMNQNLRLILAHPVLFHGCY